MVPQSAATTSSLQRSLPARINHDAGLLGERSTEPGRQAVVTQAVGVRA
jgi:hypothetical protein